MVNAVCVVELAKSVLGFHGLKQLVTGNRGIFRQGFKDIVVQSFPAMCLFFESSVNMGHCCPIFRLKFVVESRRADRI